MDWPLDDPKFDNSDVEDLFEYEPRESRVVHCLADGKNFMHCALESEQEWTVWLEKGLFPCVEGIQPGLGVILAGRAEEDHGHNSAILEYLPFSQNTFAQIARKLPIHGDMARIISRSDACFFSETNLVDFNAGVIFYCCRTSSTWPNDLAVSSSFNPKTGFTAALVLGCDKNLMESISMRIYNSESTSTHPLLIMGILAEIERERHTELVRDRVFHLLKRVYAMSNTEQISATSTLHKENYSVDLWIKMSQLRIGLESWKMQLQKIITSIDEFEQRILCMQSSDQRSEKEDHKNDSWKPMCKRAGQRIKKRLLEIVCDYDEKIRECTMVIDGMTLATHLSWNQIGYQNTQANLRIASDTKNDSSQMKSVALLTMVFLPATFVSSLFSMTFFNWYPQNGQGILSPYVWIYPVVTICITLVVVGIWYIFTKKCRAPSKDESIV